MVENNIKAFTVLQKQREKKCLQSKDTSQQQQIAKMAINTNKCTN